MTGFPELPDSRYVDARALARVLNNTTTSYKFLFFLSLLDHVAGHIEKPERLCRLDRLAVAMVARAWYPAEFFHLSFGARDRVVSVIKALDLPSNLVTRGADAKREIARLLERQRDETGLTRLLRYVPARLLRPFFQEDLADFPDRSPAFERRIAALSVQKFESRRPLYRLAPEGMLEIHEA